MRSICLILCLLCVPAASLCGQNRVGGLDGERQDRLWGLYETSDRYLIVARSVKDPGHAALYDSRSHVFATLHRDADSLCTPGCSQKVSFTELPDGTVAMRLREGLHDADLHRLPEEISDLNFARESTVFKGRFWKPAGRGPFPAVVLIGGTGKNLRDDFRIYPYLFLRAGYAVYAFDKRGSGESGGDPNVSDESMDGLAADNLAAVDKLRHLSDVDPKRIGVLGISHGAWVAVHMAALSPLIAFVIPVVGGGVPIWEATAFEQSKRLRHSGFTDSECYAARVFLQTAFDDLSAGRSDRLFTLIDSSKNESWFKATPLAPFAGAPSDVIRAIGSQRWKDELSYDPFSDLTDLRVPTLSITGDRDESVPGPETALRIKSATGGAAQTVVLQGASHYQFIQSDGDVDVYAAELATQLESWLHTMKK